MKTYFLSLNKQIDQINRSKSLNNLTVHYLAGYIILVGVLELVKGIIENIQFNENRFAIPLSQDPLPLLFLIIAVCVGIGIALGTLYAWYESNGGDKGRELLPKIFLLGWILWWRVFLASIPFLLFIGFNVSQENYEMMRTAGILTFLYSIGAAIYVIVAMSRGLRETREYEMAHKRVRHNHNTVEEPVKP